MLAHAGHGHVVTTPTPSLDCTLNGQPVACDQVADAFGGLFAGLGLFLIFFFIIMLAIGIAAFVFTILMIIHAAQNDIKDRAVWIVLMVLTGAIGAIIYFFAVKQPYDRQQQKVAAKPARRRPRKPASRR